MKIIIDNKIPFLFGVLEPFVDVVYVSGNKISREHCRDANALIVRTRTKCNAELLEGTSVKFIASATIGYDHIDTEYCEKNGIVWSNAPGCNSGSVKQWILSALLFYFRDKKIDLTKRTLGVIGVGNVGQKVVELAESLGLRVLLNDPPRQRNEGRCGFVSLETLLKECDILTFHVPLNREGEDKTYHLVDDDFVSRLNPGTVLINSSRGEVMCNKALLKGITQGKLGDVLLDVWEDEPNVNLELLEKTAIATPHIAGYSYDGKANGSSMAVQFLSRLLDLPLEVWFPDDIEPVAGELEVDAEGKSFYEVLSEVLECTYNIKDDDASLKNSPELFEKLRGSYSIRREPHCWQVKLLNDTDKYSERLKDVGFDVQ